MEDPPGTIARPRELGTSFRLAGVRARDPHDVAAGHGPRTPRPHRGTDADGQFSIWNIAWVARTLVRGPAASLRRQHLLSAPTTLAYLRGQPAAGRPRHPRLLARGNPWLTLNVVLLVAFASSFVGALLLARYLTGDRPPRPRRASSTRSVRT